jgi:hypothetical protein
MNLDAWKVLAYAALAVALLAGATALSAWIEREKYVDCRGAGHSIAVCAVRSVL